MKDRLGKPVVAIFTLVGLSTTKSVHWWVGQYAISSMDLSAAPRNAQVEYLEASF